MRKFIVLLCAISAFAFNTGAQGVAVGRNMNSAQVADPALTAKMDSMYQKKLFINGKDTMPYRLLLPELYDSSKKYPMLLFLHGSGERGNDNKMQLVHGGTLFVKDENLRKFHAIVVFPQCPENGYWSNVKRTEDPTTKKETFQFRPDGDPTPAMSMVMALENKLLAEYPVNKEKVYVMGLSMGGMGTYEIVRRMPGVFAAAIPICGGADTTTARAIKKTAFWIIHGEKDDVISVQYSKDMAEAIQRFYTAAEMQLTIYPDADHNSWDKAFAEPDLLPWLYRQQRMK